MKINIIRSISVILAISLFFLSSCIQETSDTDTQTLQDEKVLETAVDDAASIEQVSEEELAPATDTDIGSQEDKKEPQEGQEPGPAYAENDIMFYNSEVCFAFIYPQQNTTVSSYQYWEGDYGDLSLNVKINPLISLKGSEKQDALDEMAALSKGDFGIDTDFAYGPSKKVVKSGDVYVKEYLVLGRYDICDVSFDWKVTFYNNDHQVNITLSADREKMIESLDDCFKKDDEDCPGQSIWDIEKQDKFYKDLITGKLSGLPAQWYYSFDSIMHLLQINEFKGASAGYSRLIDKRLFEENLESKYVIDASYPQFQSSVIGGLDKSINKVIYEEEVLAQIESFKEEIYSYEDEDFPFNYFLAMDYSIVNYDQNAISLSIDTYPYLGGAHGMLYFSTMNFDLKKGIFIELEDLFIPGYDYLEEISSYCREDIIRQMNKRGFEADEEWVKDGTDPGYKDTFTNYLISPSGLIMKFPAYQVGPYAAGDFSVMIPFEVFGDNLDPEGIAAYYI